MQELLDLESQEEAFQVRWYATFTTLAMQCPLASWYLHFTSLHFTSLHFTSLHFSSLHFTSLHFTYQSFSLFSWLRRCRSAFLYPCIRIRWRTWLRSTSRRARMSMLSSRAWSGVSSPPSWRPSEKPPLQIGYPYQSKKSRRTHTYVDSFIHIYIHTYMVPNIHKHMNININIFMCLHMYSYKQIRRHELGHQHEKVLLQDPRYERPHCAAEVTGTTCT